MHLCSREEGSVLTLRSVCVPLNDFVPEDGLLDEQNITASLFDLFHHVKDVRTLLTQHTIHLSIVRHHDLVVHLHAGHTQNLRRSQSSKTR